jgi:hypothetical protein
MRPLKLRVQAILSLLFAAIGVWIVIAPTAVGYQPRGGSWPAATLNDVVVGSVLVVVSLGILAAQLITTTRHRLRAVEATEA